MYTLTNDNNVLAPNVHTMKLPETRKNAAEFVAYAITAAPRAVNKYRMVSASHATERGHRKYIMRGVMVLVKHTRVSAVQVMRSRADRCARARVCVMHYNAAKTCGGEGRTNHKRVMHIKAYGTPR